MPMRIGVRQNGEATLVNLDDFQQLLVAAAEQHPDVPVSELVAKVCDMVRIDPDIGLPSLRESGELDLSVFLSREKKKPTVFPV